MNTTGKMPEDECVRIPGEERLKRESIQWSRQAAVALSLKLMAWPERDVSHWFGGAQAQPELKVMGDGHLG
jgi:hypothetical protein